MTLDELLSFVIEQQEQDQDEGSAESGQALMPASEDKVSTQSEAIPETEKVESAVDVIPKMEKVEAEADTLPVTEKREPARSSPDDLGDQIPSTPLPEETPSVLDSKTKVYRLKRLKKSKPEPEEHKDETIEVQVSQEDHSVLPDEKKQVAASKPMMPMPPMRGPKPVSTEASVVVPETEASSDLETPDEDAAFSVELPVLEEAFIPDLNDPELIRALDEMVEEKTEALPEMIEETLPELESSKDDDSAHEEEIQKTNCNPENVQSGSLFVEKNLGFGVLLSRWEEEIKSEDTKENVIIPEPVFDPERFLEPEIVPSHDSGFDETLEPGSDEFEPDSEPDVFTESDWAILGEPEEVTDVDDTMIPIESMDDSDGIAETDSPLAGASDHMDAGNVSAEVDALSVSGDRDTLMVVDESGAPDQTEGSEDQAEFIANIFSEETEADHGVSQPDEAQLNSAQTPEEDEWLDRIHSDLEAVFSEVDEQMLEIEPLFDDSVDQPSVQEPVRSEIPSLIFEEITEDVILPKFNEVFEEVSYIPEPEKQRPIPEADFGSEPEYEPEIFADVLTHVERLESPETDLPEISEIIVPLSHQMDEGIGEDVKAHGGVFDVDLLQEKLDVLFNEEY